MKTGLMIGAALGAPELAHGFTQAGKDMKTVNRKVNPYDLKMNPNTQGLQMSVDSAADQMKAAESLTERFIEKVAEDTKSSDKHHFLKVYGIPVGVAGIALARGKMTGNYLQFPFYDTANFAKKVVPGLGTTFINLQAKNPNLRGKAQTAAKVMASASKNAAKNKAKSSGGSFGHSVASGAGWIGGGVLAEDAINKARNKQASFEKEAKEVPNTPINHVKKMAIEGIVHPSVKALPIYVTPVALGFAINKDIKSGDFAPVRDMTKEQKAKKNEKNKSQTDFASYNNAVLNNQLLSMASSLAEQYEKLAALKMPNGIKNLTREKPDTIKIKDWRDLPEDAAIAGLGAASMMVPIALMAKSDPIQSVKRQIAADAAAKQKQQAEHEQKKVLKKVIRKEVRKEVENAVG